MCVPRLMGLLGKTGRSRSPSPPSRASMTGRRPEDRGNARSPTNGADSRPASGRFSKENREPEACVVRGFVRLPEEKCAEWKTGMETAS